MSAALAAERAAAHLASWQRADGHWEDFRLPVGRSTAWVTAYVGLALADSGLPAAAPPAMRAAEYLGARRPYAAGWGFNGTTGPDADSTAYALLCLRACGATVLERDREWLRECRRGGGFATYPRPEASGAWGQPHADVTPLCWLALDREEEGGTAEWLLAQRRGDGTWPSYWWQTDCYATFWAQAVLGARAPPIFPPALARDPALLSSFDLAFAAGLASLTRSPLAGALGAALLARQEAGGGWPGGANLRVTDPDCERPWEGARGTLYPDGDGLLTTASALRIISVLSDRVVVGGRSLQ